MCESWLSTPTMLTNISANKISFIWYRWKICAQIHFPFVWLVVYSSVFEENYIALEDPLFIWYKLMSLHKLNIKVAIWISMYCLVLYFSLRLFTCCSLVTFACSYIWHVTKFYWVFPQRSQVYNADFLYILLSYI